MNSAAQLLLERAAGLDSEPVVPSPCISVCRIAAATGWCEGCFRTLDEIAAWSSMSEPERRRVWQCLTQRALQR